MKDECAYWAKCQDYKAQVKKIEELEVSNVSLHTRNLYQGDQIIELEKELKIYKGVARG